VTRLDDLLLMVVQHWARDEFVFPTEDDRHDVATVMLFQAYTDVDPRNLFTHRRAKPAFQYWGVVAGSGLGDGVSAEYTLYYAIQLQTKIIS
jgi:hypothetical protein